MRVPPVLTQNAGFRALWASRVISFAGDGAAAVALVVLAADRHGPTGVSLMLLAQAVPRFFGPLAGAAVDRMDQRALMRWCELGQFALVVLIALTLPSLPVLLVLVAGMSALVTLFTPAGRSAIPVLVGDDQRMPANALMSVAANLELAVGGLLGGGLLAVAGLRGALLLDAGTFLVSAALLGFVPRLPPAPGGRAESFRASVAGGVAHARRDPMVRAVAVSVFVVVALAGMDNVALVFLAREVLDAGAGGYGVLYAAFGAGMLLASVALAVRAARGDAVGLLAGAIALTGVGNALTGAAPVLGVAMAGQALGGVANGVHNVAEATLIQDRVPRELLGRVFGLVGTAAQAGQVCALGLAAVALQVTGPREVFVGSGLAMLAVAGVLVRALRRADAAAP